MSTDTKALAARLRELSEKARDATTAESAFAWEDEHKRTLWKHRAAILDAMERGEKDRAAIEEIGWVLVSAVTPLEKCRAIDAIYLKACSKAALAPRAGGALQPQQPDDQYPGVPVQGWTPPPEG